MTSDTVAPRLGRTGLLAWLAALLGAGAVLAALDYRTRDPDSVLHTKIVEQISPRPLPEWIAPVWPPRWYMQGLYREHPVGIAVLPALLARTGYPAEQAAYVVNALYQVLALLLIQRLALTFADGLEARTLGWTLQLLPIAFTYRIRANHEAAILLCLLAALYGTERSRAQPLWAALTAVALVAMALVKGIFVLFGPIACAAWLLVRGRGERTQAGSWPLLAIATAAVPAVAAVYEALYRAAVGEPFLAVYLSRQLGVASEAHSDVFLLQKAYNLVWYLARVLWFAFPWSLALLGAAWARAPALAALVRAPEGGRPEEGPARADQGLAVVLLLSAVYLGVFTLSDRKADRYLFPVYWAVGACGTVGALRRWPALRRAAARVDRLGPLAPVAVWTLTFALHIAGGKLHLPRIKIWTSD